MLRRDRDFPASYQYGSVIDGDPKAPPISPKQPNHRNKHLGPKEMAAIYRTLFHFTDLKPEDLRSQLPKTPEK